MTLEAVFVRDGERFSATELGRGPWDPTTLHGGAPAALLVHAFEDCEPHPDLRLARVTYDLMRPVPIGLLSVTAQVVRAGRRVMLLEGSIRDEQGTELVRARALRVRAGELGEPPSPPPPFPGPDQGDSKEFAPGARPMFATDAMEIRFVEGSFLGLGPSTAWFRLRCPIVAGEPVSPFERLVAAGDFGNGISIVLSWEEHVFINPDLTVYLEREPRGEWVALRARTRVGLGSVALAESSLWDVEGRIGTAIQALLVSRRPPST